MKVQLKVFSRVLPHQSVLEAAKAKRLATHPPTQEETRA